MSDYARTMKVFSLPGKVRGVVFDIDNTLYRNDAYTRDQTTLLIERLAAERREPVERTDTLVRAYREEARAAEGGRMPSLGNTFLHFGIPIQVSVKWRQELLVPERYLDRDDELNHYLGALAGRYPLVCVTNNPNSVGRRTLRALGIEANFRGIVGLDDSLVSKPNPRPFEMAAKLAGLTPDVMVSVGDRYEVDLEPALALGMGAILVESRGDLFSLPL